MDKLDRIFDHQKALDDFICKSRGLEDISMEEWIQKETLAMMSELAELIDEVNFKWWKNKKAVDPSLVKDELVDILHFFVSMCLKTGMSAEELFERYTNKNKENHDRQHGLSKKEGYDLSELE
jgi:dimeric dUTPase (all-alpha-NTP-PPase superfamily)